MAVSSVGPTIVDLVESMEPFKSALDDDSALNEPAALVVLASERRTFFEEVYGTADFGDGLEQYGTTRAPILVDGQHFDVVMRCISARVPAFTRALEEFLQQPRSHPAAAEDDLCVPATPRTCSVTDLEHII